MVKDADLELALEIVSEAFEVSVTKLMERGRQMRVCMARWVVMRILRDEVGYSWSDVGRMMGLDHGTVMHGVKVSMEWQAQSGVYFTKCALAIKQFREIRGDCGKKGQAGVCPLCGAAGGKAEG